MEALTLSYLWFKLLCGFVAVNVSVEVFVAVKVSVEVLLLLRYLWRFCCC